MLEPALDIFAIVNFLGVGQAIFWAVLLLGLRRDNKVANRILATLLLALAFGVISATLYSSRYILQLPYLAELATPVFFLYPPLVFLYVQALTKQDFSLKRGLYHFIPFLVCVFYLLPFYIQPNGSKIEFLQNQAPSGQQFSVIPVIALVFESVYIVSILILLHRHARKIRDNYSTLERVNLNWLRNLIFGFLFVTILYFIFSFANWSDSARAIVPASITVFVYYMGYRAIRQPQVFTQPMNGHQKYLKSGLDERRAKHYRHKLLRIMDEQKPYLDANLTLKELASRISISPNYLSQLLNERLNQSFFDFVNNYRIEEAKREIRNPQKSHLTLLAIAYDAGFNSKSAFNAAFKRVTGMTPSQFRRTLRTPA